MTSPARDLAYRTLSDIRRRDAFAPAALDAALAGADLDPRDAGLATRLVYGSLEFEGTLDELIDGAATRPGSIEPKVRDALRIGAYELVFGRAPAHAVVSEWVGLIKRRNPRASGFANAVLRRIAERADAFPFGDPATDRAALARATGHPAWLVDLILNDVGESAGRAMLGADAEGAPMYLWHNPFAGGLDDALAALADDGAEPVATAWPGVIEASRPGAAVRGSAVADGLVLVTDAAATVASLATGGHPGAIVVDAAAGRGTKTAELQALAFAAGGAADVRGLDLHAFKAKVLTDRMAALGVPGVTAAVADAGAPLGRPGVPAAGSAAAVLLDAPCSGLGSLRRRPEKRWRVTPDDIAQLAALQARLLAGVAPLVAPGGVLVYATCTVTRAENDEVVDTFIASEAGDPFESIDLRDTLPAAWAEHVDDAGRFRTVPTAGGPDGHFVVALRHRG